nr:nucleoporin nic96 [Quercus suber]
MNTSAYGTTPAVDMNWLQHIHSMVDGSSCRSIAEVICAAEIKMLGYVLELSVHIFPEAIAFARLLWPTMASLFNRMTPANNSSAPSSGLFGTAPGPSQAGQSLFGAANNTAATNTAGTFGNPPSSSNSLFGGNNATTSGGGSSLFGANRAAPAVGNLFGNNNINTSNPVTSNSTSNTLLGANASTGPALTQSNSNASLFGNNILPSSTHNQVLANPDAPAPQPAYFQALLERGNKRQREEFLNPFSDLPQLQLGLADIQRKVRNIGQGGPSAESAKAGDARSHYLLAGSGVNTSEALRDIQDLASSVRPSVEASHRTDFSQFSGVKDVLAQHHKNSFTNMVERNLQKSRADFDKMIEDRMHGVDWDAHRQRIYVHFGLKKPQAIKDSTADDAAAGEGGAFGKTSRRSRFNGSSSFGATRSIIGAPGVRGARMSTFGDELRPAPEDRVQRLKQESYASKVKDLNIARLQAKIYPVLAKFSEIEAEPSTDDTSMLVNAYTALIAITGEDSSKDNASDPGAIKERQYATDYLQDQQNNAKHIAVRKRIIRGSRRFLENHFLQQLEVTVGKNPRDANVGGVPTAIAKVKGYVRVRAARKELGPDIEVLQEINGDYCWAVLFYLFRCGLFQDAQDYVEENQAAFRLIDRSFVRYLRAFANDPEQRLPQDMQTAINNEYSQRQRAAPEDSIDPYRMICYKVIGRCDVHRRSLEGITNDMMDWTWLQFALAREYSRVDEFAHEAFGLDELRTSIREIGERYFNAGSEIANAPTTYFFMQILAGMFESAVANFYPHNYVSAVHFAIGLDFYGLLRVSDVSNSEDLLTTTTRQQPQIAFGNMIGLYTRDFRTSDATAAIDYLALICLNQDLPGALGKAQCDLCHQAINEVVLETREFAQLLGDVRSDGTRIKGAVEKLLTLIGLEDQEEFMKKITLSAARTAEQQSRTTDAALLFHLSEDFDKVMEVCNEAVSLVLTTELGEQPARLTPLKPRNPEQQSGDHQQTEVQGSLSLTSIDNPIVLATNMKELYSSSAMYQNKIRPINAECTVVLLQLSRARRALEEGKWTLAVDVSRHTFYDFLKHALLTRFFQYITNSRVLPTDTSGNISAIRQVASTFNSMPQVVARTIGHVLLWTVVGCSRSIRKVRETGFDTGAQQDAIAKAKNISRDVMVFAGLIKYKLPGKVWETLAKAGQDMGSY